MSALRAVARWLKRHRVLVGLMGLTLLAAVAVFLVFFRNQATPVDLAEALRRYRSQHRSGGPVNSALPAPGVYVYATVGSESLSLPGGSRSYPGHTSMIVTPAACGVRVRWIPLTEHIEDNQDCIDHAGGLLLVSTETTEQFFGITTREAVSCSPQAYLVPPTAHPGQAWSFTCSEPQIDWRGSGVVVGLETRRIGATTVPVWHTHVTLNISGRNGGTNPADYWFALDRSLLVAWRGSVDVAQGNSPIGAVHYHEDFDLHLLRLSPAE